MILDSENAIMDKDGNMVVEEGCQSLDFIPVTSLQVAKVTMSRQTISDENLIFGAAVNCG